MQVSHWQANLVVPVLTSSCNHHNYPGTQYNPAMTVIRVIHSYRDTPHLPWSTLSVSFCCSSLYCLYGLTSFIKYSFTSLPESDTHLTIGQLPADPPAYHSIWLSGTLSSIFQPFLLCCSVPLPSNSAILDFRLFVISPTWENPQAPVPAACPLYAVT
jgi:hypothetical protein